MFKLGKLIFGVIIIMALVFDFAVADTDLNSSKPSDIIEQDVQVPVLLYHNIMDGFDIEQSSVHISPALFEEHMMFLKDAGYRTITFDEYYDYVASRKELPDNSIIITFDDGYSSNYKYAYPILKRMDMKATIFTITGRVGSADDVIYPHFTWEQAKEMQQSGVIDIQSHSDLHTDMMKISTGRVQLELRHSKYLIEKNLGKVCDVFAYPYGLYSREIQEMAIQAGYKMQVIVGDKGINGSGANLQQLKRLTAFGNMSGKELLDMIQINMEEN
ncbi:MAG: polysaccharide deacetylase family protein [Clostridia bacterium]